MQVVLYCINVYLACAKAYVVVAVYITDAKDGLWIAEEKILMAKVPLNWIKISPL